MTEFRLQKLCWAAVAAVFFAGCSKTEVHDTYGRRTGFGYEKSVNGTYILAQLFAEKGFRVSSTERFTQKLERAQVVIWFPDDFSGPPDEVEWAIKGWLSKSQGRTFVYVGRDFDAEPVYWKHVLSSFPADQAIEAARRAAMAEAEHENKRARAPENDSAWFKFNDEKPRRNINNLSGPWSAGVDASRTEIQLRRRLEIPKDVPKPQDNPQYVGMHELKFDRLLSSETDDIVYRVHSEAWPSNQLIVIANGSFLLNSQLVNSEHRILAEKLIAACTPKLEPLHREWSAPASGPLGNVVFLESGPGGPTVVDGEDIAKQPTGFESLTTFPLGAIIMHLLTLGIVTCFALSPIFGRPGEPERESGRRATDFKLHLEAMGELLLQSNNEEFARRLIDTYRRKGS